MNLVSNVQSPRPRPSKYRGLIVFSITDEFSPDVLLLNVSHLDAVDFLLRPDLAGHAPLRSLLVLGRRQA